jgi:hypothetical protein
MEAVNISPNNFAKMRGVAKKIIDEDQGGAEIKDVPTMGRTNAITSSASDTNLAKSDVVAVAGGGVFTMFGFTIPMHTLYLIIAVIIIAILLWYITKPEEKQKKKKRSEHE